MLDAIEIGRGRGQRFFRHNVQLASRALENDFGALAVSAADANYVELFMVEQLVPVAICAHAPAVFAGRQVVRDLRIAVPDRRQLDLRQAVEGIENLTGVAFEPDDGQAHFLWQPHDLMRGGLRSQSHACHPRSSRKLSHAEILPQLRVVNRATVVCYLNARFTVFALSRSVVRTKSTDPLPATDRGTGPTLI